MTADTGETPDRMWAEEWQRSWDDLEDGLMGDRELRLAALVDIVEGVVGSRASIIDLACGTGTVTRRLLERTPAATAVAVDVDPCC